MTLLDTLKQILDDCRDFFDIITLGEPGEKYFSPAPASKTLTHQYPSRANADKKQLSQAENSSSNKKSNKMN